MKNKIITVVLTVLACVTFASCGVFVDSTSGSNSDSSVTDTSTVTITFKQEGKADIVKTLEKGDTLSDVPTPDSKTGYTVTWNRTDFTNIQSNITVTAQYSANTYTVTYEADGFAIDGTTTTLTYDALCTSLDMSLTKEDYTFLGWSYKATTYTQTSVWDVADNVTLTASWVGKDQAVITFTNTDGSTITKKVEKGATLTDIPTPKAETGYTVAWNRTDFTNITENITVTAVKTAKQYTVTLNPNGGTLSTKSFTIKYGEAYSLKAPMHNGSYMFIAWTYLQQEIPSNGVWNIDEEDGTIQLVAAWDLYSGEY